VDAAVAALTSVIEPVIIVFMGIVIGGILIAMYLPMFDIIGKIR
jgi:type IV pilus assembly protein PilC